MSPPGALHDMRGSGNVGSAPRNRHRQRAQTSWFVRGDFRLIVSQDQRIWLEGAEKFVIAPLYPIVTIAGNCMEALDVQNGDAPPADLNKTGMLEGALYQIDGGSLDAKHLSEKFLRKPDVIAS